MEGPRLTRARRQASAVAQSAVFSPAKQQRSSQSASGRQPPLCAVQPGRSLELRTSLGLLRVRQLLQQQQSFSTATNDSDEQSQDTKSRSQLKSARLQPLGIVEDELLSSELCLGILTANTQRQIRRPRSSTAPGVHFDIPDATGSSNRSVTGKRRSHSAILARTVDTRHLMKLLSVSKHTGFQPQTNNNRVDHHIEAITLEQTPPVQALKPLPPVVKYGELGMKVEVKGLREVEQSKKTHSKDLATKISPKRKNLPPIHKTPSPIKQVPPISSSKSCSPRSSSTPSGTSSPQRPVNVEPIRVSVVSVGEGVATGGEHPQLRQHKRKSSGRLSHGWSPPQTVQPITGSAVGSLSSQGGRATTPTNPNNSMLLAISPTENNNS